MNYISIKYFAFIADEKHLNASSFLVTGSPVIAGASAMLGEIHILGIVQLGVGRIENGGDDARLQVEKNRARDVMFVVSLSGGQG